MKNYVAICQAILIIVLVALLAQQQALARRGTERAAQLMAIGKDLQAATERCVGSLDLLLRRP